MNEKIATNIQGKLGIDLIDIMVNKLSGSELNSLLMKVFAMRANQISPGELLKSYQSNRFAKPAETNFIKLLHTSATTLEFLLEKGFVPKQLSPLVPLGTCSVLATVDQNKVVSATRNGEILSDATNAMALDIADQKRKLRAQGQPDSIIKHSTVQRHMRAQFTNIKGFDPHFTIGCLVTSGRDKGNFNFEFAAIKDHLSTLTELLIEVFKVDELYVKLQPRGSYNDSFIPKLTNYLTSQLQSTQLIIDSDSKPNNYYLGVQFKVVIKKFGRELEIADGGLVDWTQKLLNDKKERYCISGFGLELLNKLEEELI